MTRKNIFIIAAMLLVILLGLAAVIYPLLALQHSNQTQREVVVDYNEEIQEKDTQERDAARAAAQTWNEQLFGGMLNTHNPEQNGYFDLLNLSGNGCMGYIEIPKINIQLPIYHGVGDNALDHGAGHIPQTSLPVGGENTHAAISAHTGMASNPMFTDLELMELGDVFYIYILGETLSYQVESIEVVEPMEIDSLQIQRGRDLVTLITCTPYGVNTHRLLVRGCRVEKAEAQAQETPPASEEVDIGTDSLWVRQYVEAILTGLLLAAIILAVAAVGYCIYRRRWKDSISEKATKDQ